MSVILAWILDVTAAENPLPDLELEVTVAAGNAVHHRYRLEYRRGEEFGRVRYWDVFSQSWEREDTVGRDQIRSAIRHFKNRGLLRIRMSSDARLIVTFKERGRTFQGDGNPELSTDIREFIAGRLRG